MTSRCRERAEGRLSRRRTYTCRRCHVKFQVDTVRPLPEKEMRCPACQQEGIVEHPGRCQPYTVWHKGFVVFFANTRKEAEAKLAEAKYR